MRIDSIDFECWKNLNGTLKLGERTLLFGPNGSGKTATLWAIGWVATGKSPLGATNEASSQLFTGGAGSVTLHLEGGGSIKRCLHAADRPGGESAYQQIINIDGRNVDKKRGELEILKRLGDFAPAFNLRAFTDLSPEKRRAFVVQLIGGADCDKLTAELDSLTETINTTTRTLRDAEAAARGIADPHQSRPSHVVAAEVATLEGEIRDLREEIGKAEGQRESVKRALERCEWLRGQLAGMPASGSEGGGTEAAALDQAAADLDAKAGEVLFPDLGAATEKLRAARAAVSTINLAETAARADAIDRRREADQCASDLAHLRRRIAEAEASPWSLASRFWLQVKSADDEDSRISYVCLGELIQEQLAKAKPGGLPEAESALADTEKARDAAKLAHDQACEALKAALIQRDAAERQWTEATRLENTGRLQQQSLQQQAKDKRRQAETIRQKDQTASENRQLWQAELDGLERGMRNAPEIDPDDLRALLEAKKAVLGGRQAEAEASRQAEAADQARTKANQRVDALRTDLDAFQARRDEIKANRDLLLGERLERLTGPLAAFLAAARRGTDPRIDLYDGHGRPAFRVGWSEDGRKVTLNENYTSSGWSTFGAGLAYAMLQVTDAPYRPLLLDGGEIDATNLTSLMDGLTGLPGLDQVILTSHLTMAAITAPDGWESRLMPLAVKRQEQEAVA